MRRLLAVLGVVLVGVSASSCATGRPPEDADAWRAALGRDHRLAGRIWDGAKGRFTTRARVVERLAGARFVLLGEKHDNPDHHRLQAWLLRALIARGRRPAVAFEMFDADMQPAIARHLAAAPRDAAGLGAAVDWQSSGWPEWSLYRPIARAALDAGLPIVAANLPRTWARAFRRGEGLPPELTARLGLDRPLPPDARRAMAAEIHEAHCRLLPAAAAERMVDVQRARDAHMAAALAAAGADGAVLIAGAGHVRRDRGVPAHLAARLPEASVATVAFVEVAAGVTDPAAYAARWGVPAAPFDFVWFTPRVDDRDPCEPLRQRLERVR